ncbi:uncharacterized protein [Spinacia oleracea]|uniref:RNase H type-1 domain-containing protein n=1 Tax=Spinacia oleracea TaxID=3562 RepID=A0ABM3QY99_SPIOL|nr:uncharacterized protein LOC130463286 [Spinacia oleracea]
MTLLPSLLRCFHQNRCGVGVILISPESTHNLISTKLQLNVTNNATDYEACIMGLEADIAIGVQKLRVYEDSSLIVNQISRKWKVKSERLAPYQSYIAKLSEQVEQLRYTYLPREENQFANALAKLASMINIPSGLTEMPLIIEPCQDATYVYAILGEEPEEERPWFTDILEFVHNSEYPPHFSRKNQRALRIQAANIIIERAIALGEVALGVRSLECIDLVNLGSIFNFHTPSFFCIRSGCRWFPSLSHPQCPAQYVCPFNGLETQKLHVVVVFQEQTGNESLD